MPALAPASATDALISFRKLRRDGPSGHSEASGANSRCNASKCAELPASSSSVRQGCWSFPSMSLSMANRAIGQLVRVNVILFHQLQAFDYLFLSFRLLPGHVKHLVARPQILFRRAMTIQAPFHLQRRMLHHQRHLVHLPMTRRAADAFLNVNPMIEI